MTYSFLIHMEKMIKEQIGEFMDEDKIDDVVDYAIDKIGIENVLKKYNVNSTYYQKVLKW